MVRRYWAAFFFIAELIVLFLLLLQNQESISLSLVAVSLRIPLGLAVCLGALLGGGLPVCGYIYLDKRKVNEAKVTAWQSQDAKLMASVASDREKQLEAKISTLEVALKTALKKKQG
jgi:uncharacterized integral membrane protein